MIGCTVWGCFNKATHGGIFRHENKGRNTWPVYYYCGEHAVKGLTEADDSWPVNA